MQFGREYLTYILWAITPEGRATNLGELQINGDDGHLDVTTELQAFALMVTAGCECGENGLTTTKRTSALAL